MRDGGAVCMFGAGVGEVVVLICGGREGTGPMHLVHDDHYWLHALKHEALNSTSIKPHEIMFICYLLFISIRHFWISLAVVQEGYLSQKTSSLPMTTTVAVKQ